MANRSEERIEKIEVECSEIRRQILQLEFQHKKDDAETEKRFKERSDKIQLQLDYITKLAGITYEELDLLDGKLLETGYLLIEPRQPSKQS